MPDGDEPPRGGRRVVVGTYLPPYELDVMGAIGEARRQSRSKVLRLAVERALDGAPGGAAVG